MKMTDMGERYGDRFLRGVFTLGAVMGLIHAIAPYLQGVPSQTINGVAIVAMSGIAYGAYTAATSQVVVDTVNRHVVESDETIQ